MNKKINKYLESTSIKPKDLLFTNLLTLNRIKELSSLLN